MSLHSRKKKTKNKRSEKQPEKTRLPKWLVSYQKYWKPKDSEIAF